MDVLIQPIRIVAPLRHCLSSKKCYNTWTFSGLWFNLPYGQLLIGAISPNAEEALNLLSLPLPPNKSIIEKAARKFLDFGIGNEGHGSVVVRSGELGAYVKSRGKNGVWVDAYWTESQEGAQHVVDVTGERCVCFLILEGQLSRVQALETAFSVV